VRKKYDLSILFATDLHGSEAAFRKFLNAGLHFQADVLVMGGDLAGKALVPVVSQNGGVVADLGSKRMHASGDEEIAELEKTIRMTGRYPFRCSEEEVHHLQEHPEDVDKRFLDEMVGTLQRWMDLAQERLGPRGVRLIGIAGNDDPVELDKVIERHPYAEWVDGRVVEIGDGIEVVGYSWVNPTPWDSPREHEEERLGQELEGLVKLLRDPERSIWNVHVPPHNTGLDLAPEVTDDYRIVNQGGTPKMIPVGSTSLRAVLEAVQPIASVHGHVHESRARVKLGRTLAVNPGSAYSEGTLQAAFLRVGRKGADVQFLTA
jgi:Icc-related predicted phosphoesterase